MSISAKITAFFISQGIVPDEDREVYEYGFELLLTDLFNFSVILLISAITGLVWPTMIYICIFVGLRSVCGGYHAKTHLRCHICTIGAYFLFIVLLNMQAITDKATVLLIGDFFAAIPVILFAPIPHTNKPLSPKAYNRNRLLSIILFTSLFLMAIFLRQLERPEGIIISLALWIVSLCMIPAIKLYPFTKRRKNHEKNR